LGGNPKIARHNQVVLELESVFRECGQNTQREVCSALANKSRPDLVSVSRDGTFVTDVTVTCPAQVTLASNPAPFAAAARAASEKGTKWDSWAADRGMDFAPLVLESSGAIWPESLRWIRRVLRGEDHALTISTTVQHALARVTSALHRLQVVFFCYADKGLTVVREKYTRSRE